MVDVDDLYNHPPGEEPKQTAIRPSFCRQVIEYLAQGKNELAHELCRRGVASYPQYTTGHLLLGKTYEMLGRYVEAVLEYKYVLRTLPGNVAVNGLLQGVEQKEAEAFEEYARKQERMLGEKTTTVTLDSYLTDPPLASPTKPSTSATVRFVTQTLAEIYASQGEYDEAIQAYRKLMEQRPQDAQRYSERMTELEALARAAAAQGNKEQKE
jgi:tetratricopeptide (TPR) repeat protein